MTPKFLNILLNPMNSTRIARVTERQMIRKSHYAPENPNDWIERKRKGDVWPRSKSAYAGSCVPSPPPAQPSEHIAAESIVGVRNSTPRFRTPLML
jgi:hypothetical protein